MATRTVGEFAARIATLPGAIVEATPQAVRAAGAVLEQAARTNVLAATGGDARLSGAMTMGARRGGTGGAGKRIELELRVQGTGSRARALVVPRGPIMLVEGPTARHRIPRKLQGYNYHRRVYKRPGVFIPGRGFFASVNHPGTKGKRPVRRAFQSHSSEAAQVGLALFATSARRHITGS
jgi:hypothetical protein